MFKALFRQPKPRSFHYNPRFYSEQREFLAERRAAAEGSEVAPDRLSAAWKRRSREVRSAHLGSNRRAMLIAALIVLILYLFFR